MAAVRHAEPARADHGAASDLDGGTARRACDFSVYYSADTPRDASFPSTPRSWLPDDLASWGASPHVRAAVTAAWSPRTSLAQSPPVHAPPTACCLYAGVSLLRGVGGLGRAGVAGAATVGGAQVSWEAAACNSSEPSPGSQAHPAEAQPPSPASPAPLGGSTSLLCPSLLALPGSAIARMLASVGVLPEPPQRPPSELGWAAQVEDKPGGPHHPPSPADADLERGATSDREMREFRDDLLPTSSCTTAASTRRPRTDSRPQLWHSGLVCPSTFGRSSFGRDATSPAPLTLSTRHAVGALRLGAPGLRPPLPTEALPSGFHSAAAARRELALAEEGTAQFRPPDRPTVSSAAKQREPPPPAPPPPPHLWGGAALLPVISAAMSGGGGWRTHDSPRRAVLTASASGAGVRLIGPAMPVPLIGRRGAPFPSARAGRA